MVSTCEPTEDDFALLISLFKQERFLELLSRLEVLIEKFPQSAKLYNIRGVADHGLSRFDLAIKAYENAIKINPDYAEAYNNLGTTLKAHGDLDGSIQSFTKAILLKPEFAEAHNNMGGVLQDKGDHEGAIRKYKEAIKIKNDYVDAYINIGNALRQIGLIDESFENLQMAITIEPRAADAFFAIGINFREQGDVLESIKSFEEAIRINENYYEAYNHIGNNFKSIGETKKAIEIFEKVLDLKNDYFEVHRHLAMAKAYSGSEGQIQQLLNFRKKRGLKDADYININFALGKIYEDIKDYESAFLFLCEGNRLRRKELKYDINSDFELFNTIKERYSKKNSEISLLSDQLHTENTTPIFIVGMPRSGTTLVEQILSNHSSVYGGGELSFLGRAVEAFNLVGLALSKEQVNKFREFYFEQLKTIEFKEDFITDKMPLNFRWCGLILEAIPEAKIIHVTRDPMATCFSIFKSYFVSTGNRYAYDLKDIINYYKLYDDLMHFFERKFPNKIYKLNYEDLTENQEKESRSLVSFIGLNWENKCLDFHENERAVTTLSKTQVREKMYRGSSLNWKNYAPYLGNIQELIKAHN